MSCRLIHDSYVIYVTRDEVFIQYLNSYNAIIKDIVFMNIKALETDVFVDLFYNLLYKRLLGSWGLQITQNKTSLPNVLGHGRQPG